MTGPDELFRRILAFLPYEPNEQQVQVAAALGRFCTADMIAGPDRVFVLNGYAGTGKTSLTGALVKALAYYSVNTVLLAPTGRAAKVFGAFAGRPAATIHRAIYRHALPGQTGAPQLRESRQRDTVFIVDEASMIAADERENILADMIQYVYGAYNCRMILLGDTAQLPPVGSEVSPAMEPDVLRAMGLKVNRTTLTQVARQGSDSGILANATRLRRALTAIPAGTPAVTHVTGPDGAPAEPAAIVPLALDGYPDVHIAFADELPDILASLYKADGPEETIIITRSNRSATDYNQAVRNVVLGREDFITPGDLMIAAKNNYFWTRGTRGIGFVANGEILRLRRILGTETRYGLHFADVVLELPDNPEVNFEAKIIVSALVGYDAALDREGTRRLYEGVYNDPSVMPPGAPHEERLAIMRRSPYFNALQMKFAYAVTCHKAQGGQWKHVFVDLGHVPADASAPDYLRWLYTAITRAREDLYFINAPES